MGIRRRGRRSRRPKKRAVKDSDSDDIGDLVTSSSTLSEFSLDALMASRQIERERKAQREQENEKFQEEESFFSNLEIKKLISRDGSVYDFSQGIFPTSVFDILGYTHEPVFHMFPRLKDWQIASLKVHPDMCEGSPTIFFSLLQELVFTMRESYGYMLLDYARYVPVHTIEYSIWLDMLRELSHTSAPLCAFVLASASMEMFIPEERIEKDLCSIFCVSVLCPHISASPCFHVIKKKNTEILESQALSDDFIVDLANSLSRIALSSGPAAASRVVSYIPLNINGSKLLWRYSITILCQYLGFDDDFSDSLTFPFSRVAAPLKVLCNGTDDDLLVVSASLAILERAVAACLVLKFPIIDSYKALTFTPRRLGVSDLTSLREQLHITRVQLERMSNKEIV